MPGKRPKRKWLRRFGAVTLSLGAVAALLIHQNRFSESEWQIIKDKYRVFEASLERVRPDDERLAAACAELAARERVFLAGKFPKTLEAVGRAWARLEGKEWDDRLAYFWSLHVEVTPRLVADLAVPTVAKIEVAAELAGDPPGSLDHHLRVRRMVDGEEVYATASRGGLREWHVQLPTDLQPGTHELTLEVRAGEGVVGVHRFRFDVIPDLEQRIAPLEKTLRETGQRTSGRGVNRFAAIDRTARDVFDLLRGEAAGRRSDWSGDLTVLLERVETEVGRYDDESPDDPYEGATGDFTRVFPAGTAPEAAPCRLYVPPGIPEGESRPLILALHGYADDEQKWFEFYGGGILPRLARERGFILVAPRLPRFSPEPDRLCALVREIVEAYPVDEERIFVIAHSYGARHALRAATECPGRFAGLALLASAASPRAMDAAPRLPIYLACGTLDGRVLRLCRKLADRAKAQALEPFLYEEVEGVGHVEIIWRKVGDALDWLEEQVP